jgi:triosephosphate isomerase (TIM)
MYKTQEEARAFFAALKPLVAASTHCEIVIGAPFTALAASVAAAAGSAISIAAQDLYWAAEGAFTGEISPRMLVESGCRAVIIAHSERRQFFGETDETANRKVKAALAAGLTPIFCVGETLAEREAGSMRAVLERQFRGGLAALTAGEFSRIIVAYEPVWAIGTGKAATAEDAGSARRQLAELLSERRDLRILYGGSVTAENAQELLKACQVDGFLIGGASLKPGTFAAIAGIGRG